MREHQVEDHRTPGQKISDGIMVVLHDWILCSILRLTSKRYRKHQADVVTQNLHLGGLHKEGPEPGCWYCAARQEEGYFDRRR